MKIENIEINKPVKLPISEQSFIEYLQKTGWSHDAGDHHQLWRHSTGKAPLLNLSHLKLSLDSLAEHENRHVFTVWTDIMQAEMERNK